MQFSDLIGQEGIKKRLIRNVRENRLPHAQMLLGEGGYGTFPLALAYAQYILCQDKKDDDSCGECPACHKAGKMVHPDLHFVYPVATTKSVNRNPVSDDFINEWRTFVLEDPYIVPSAWYEFIGMENKQGIINVHESAAILRKLSFKSFESDYKIMIIWLPEKMNRSSANKLLKIIEEPPSKTLFIMVAENTDSMLPTVLSRTQMIKVPSIGQEELAQYLQNRFEQQGSELDAAAVLSGGNYNRAMEYMRSADASDQVLEIFIKMMRLAYMAKIPELMTWVDEISSLGRERQKSFLVYAIRMIRENFLLNLKETELAVVTQQEREFSEKFSAFITTENIEGIYSAFNLAHNHIEANAYARLVFLDMSLKLSGLIRPRKIS